jgi:Na+/proline symporter
MNVLDFSFDLENRYTVWTGMIGGLFVALAYFGTDQSQVQRYLSGRSVKESQWGLIFNGLLKVPMQFFILLVGVMVYIFFQFNQSPVFFNNAAVEVVYNSEYADDYRVVEEEYSALLTQKNNASLEYAIARSEEDDSRLQALESRITAIDDQSNILKERAKTIIKQADSNLETNDKDYVFIHFILNHLPTGLVGLLLAVIFSAAMSSTASELNALGSTTTIDIYKRNFGRKEEGDNDVWISKGFTLMWGIIAIIFATFGTLAENLIQLVNIVGSIFYGSVLGIFLVAFYLKSIKSNAVFWAACIAQMAVIIIFKLELVSYLWLNVIGCMLVIFLAFFLQMFLPSKEKN